MPGITGRLSALVGAGAMLAAAALAGSAGAQAWREIPGTAGIEGAETCATGAGGSLCFQIRCRADSPLEFALVSTPDWPLADRSTGVTLLVDATAPLAYTFAVVEPGNRSGLALPYHPAQHRGLIERLRRGVRLTVWIRPGDGRTTGAGFSLGGSGRAINRMLDGRCATLARQDPDVPLADPVLADHQPVGELPDRPPLDPSPPAATEQAVLPDVPDVPEAAPEPPLPLPDPEAAPAADTPAPEPPRPLVPVTPGTEDKAAMALAQQIVGPIIEAVRSIEGKAPTLRARLVELAPEQALLLTRLCGGAYFGPTGCSGVIFTIAGESARPVFGDGDLFSSTGLSLDEAAARDGWPALVLETGETWAWTGAGYERR
ncbi:hypothetical protein [Rhodovulum euryhalinum]|uniref:Invasion protein IalB n=1 Tax=Rhodovulum euryhalinum TaxID=35805 RepID=A0A4R2KQ90_9RHOB|nr:hypothetical protein [Rhodovulum euryhalinum]TCO73069.1 hypothetical protein EV655_103298 [Rhodovulum euryhalinum]